MCDVSHPAPFPPPKAAARAQLASGTPRARRIAANVAIVLGTFCSAALAAAYAEARIYGHVNGDSAGNLTAIAFLLSLVAATALCFRLRSTAALLGTTVAACVPPLLMPADSLPALIGMASVIVWHPDVRARWGVGVLASVATLVAVWRDSRGTRSGTSVWNSFEHPDGSSGTWPPMPLWQVVVFSALLVAAFAGVALLRRTRDDAATQRGRAEAANAHVHSLGQRLAEQDEREALAREVHDVLGHRLSILAMQANALEIEAQASGAPDVENRARQIQQGAAGSMTDLRSLLGMLREGPREHERPYELADIATLVRECIDAGTPVSSNVFVDQSQPLDPVVSRSAYRITTELLTNARKHSPGTLVHLDIRGNPRDGLIITTQNAMTPGAFGPGGGTGLAGVGRRAHDLGGDFRAGPSPDGRVYTATARLPWHLPR